MKQFLTFAVLAALTGWPAVAQDNTGTTTGATGATGVGGAETAPMQEAPATAQAEDPAVELLFWDSIKDSDNPDLFLAYLQRYPDGVFKIIAEERLKEIYSGAGDDTMEEDTAPVMDQPVVSPPTTQIITVEPADTGGGTTTGRSGPTTTRTIKGIQRQLARLGCYTGPIDGIWGPMSRRAAQKFNRRYSGFNISTDHPGTKGLERLRTVSGRVCP